MIRFLRFVFSFLLWPLVWALLRTAVEIFQMLSADGGGLFSMEGLAAFTGMVVFLLVWMFLSKPVRLYVLGHELTHAIWGLAFGAQVSGLKVRSNGGSVKLTKSNVWITLAPYFFPFWTILTVVVAGLVRLILYFVHGDGSLPWPWAWTFLVGFTWCFHLCFTIRSLCQPQPDIEEYGRFFSWILILLLNVAGVILWMTVTTDIEVSSVMHRLIAHVVSAYAGIWGTVRESIPALPILST